MGAVDAGPRTGLRGTGSKPLWETHSVFQAGVGAHSYGGDFEGASMAASGAAASTGRFEVEPPCRCERGPGERGRGSRRRKGAWQTTGATPWTLGRPWGRPVVGGYGRSRSPEWRAAQQTALASSRGLWRLFAKAWILSSCASTERDSAKGSSRSRKALRRATTRGFAWGHSSTRSKGVRA